MKTKTFLVLPLMLVCGDAMAQYVIGGIRYTCPVGTSWNDPRCIREVDEAVNPTRDATRWETRWGAISMDFTNGKYGVATNMPSKSMAQEYAIAQCRGTGGKECEDALTYHNQCGVIAWGENYAATHSAKTKEEASEFALGICKKHTEDCQIFYADCSLPERIR